VRQTAGSAEAQYQLAEIMFEESATRQRGMELLMAAADQGHGAANTRLGVFFQLGTYVAKDHARAQRFTASSNRTGISPHATIWHTLLATSPSAQLRDGNRAVTLAQPLAVLYESWGYLDTPQPREAEAGDFAAASKTEKKALAQAGSDAGAEALHDLQHRLTLFQRRTLTANPDGASRTQTQDSVQWPFTPAHATSKSLKPAAPISFKRMARGCSTPRAARSS
jgi:TPR repeat protein